VKRACEEPLRQVAGNAGWEGAIVVERIRMENDVNFGFNVKTGNYEDLVTLLVFQVVTGEPDTSRNRAVGRC
jgi:chaperonin GroEL (HSP60 family)